jgi:hypothetical protein
LMSPRRGRSRSVINVMVEAMRIAAVTVARRGKGGFCLLEFSCLSKAGPFRHL